MSKRKISPRYYLSLLLLIRELDAVALAVPSAHLCASAPAITAEEFPTPPPLMMGMIVMGIIRMVPFER